VSPEEEERRWPEHAKLKSHDEDRSNRADAIEGFLEWLAKRGVILAVEEYGQYLPIENPLRHLVAEYLGADIVKYRAEEQDMIAYAVDYFKNRNLGTSR
jgi:hypothetical protein